MADNGFYFYRICTEKSKEGNQDKIIGVDRYRVYNMKYINGELFVGVNKELPIGCDFPPLLLCDYKYCEEENERNKIKYENFQKLRRRAST